MTFTVTPRQLPIHHTHPLPEVSPVQPGEPPKKASDSDMPHPLQEKMRVLAPAGTTAVASDFGSKKEDLDQRFAALAGILPSMAVSIPPSKAEQFARDTLESTLLVINDLASQLVHQSADIVNSGDFNQQHALEESIRRFLKTAEQTMVDLTADTVSKHLGAPPSPAMKKLFDLVTKVLWRDIESMQKNMQKAFETALPGSAAETLPDASQRAQIAAHFAAENTKRFQAQLDAIDLPVAKRLDFDASKLSGIAALQQELNAVTVLARASKSGSRASTVAVEQPPAALSGWTEPELPDPADPADPDIGDAFGGENEEQDEVADMDLEKPLGS